MDNNEIGAVMEKELRIKCLVLDHDDTVVKSTPEINYPSFKKALSVLRPNEELSFERFTELNFVHGFEDLCFKYFGFSEEEMNFQLKCWHEASENIPHAYEGLAEVLHAYVRNGGRICVSTQSLAKRVLRDYREAGLPKPDLIFDWECEWKKPNPYALEEVMRIYDLKPDEVLMVDDLKTGYLMAQACGVPFACAGWSDNQIPMIREFMKKNSDYYLETVSALEKLLYLDRQDEVI